MIKPISFCINTAINELDYIKLLFKSLQDNLSTKEHEIIVFIDSDNQGTLEWLTEQKTIFPNLKILKNPLPICYGYARNINEMFKFASNDIVSYLQSDMVISKNYDVYISKHIKDNMILSSTRIEPPLHGLGLEKHTEDFGLSPKDFKYEIFLDWCEHNREEKQTEYFFAPFTMYKKVWNGIGGHDTYFRRSREDSDVLNRLILNGNKIVQTWDALVYHFTSRGSRFNKHAGGAAGKNSDEWLQTTTKNGREFIRKWGHFVLHTPTMKPIIPPKYNIGLIIKNCNDSLLHALEPWGDTLYIDEGNIPSMIDNYITLESPNTGYDLYSRLRPYDNEKNCEILVEIDGQHFTQNDFNNIQRLTQIIQNSGQIGEFKLGNIKVSIIQMNEYQNELI